MKNYPNQAADMGRVRATLQVVRELNDAGENVNDSGTFGYAAARARAYTFRYFDYDAPDADVLLEARIAQELNKPADSQGALTFAREMRRTFRDLGWIDAQGHLTAQGEALLQTPPGSHDEAMILSEALLELELDGPSHPVRILLRLLSVAPSVDRHGLELALEAADDSEAEFARIRALYEMTTADRTDALHAMGVSDTTIANARKIFPSLARAAGLVVEDPPRHYRLSPAGAAAVAVAPPPAAPAPPVAGIAAGLAPAPIPPPPAAVDAPAAVVRRTLRATSPESIAEFYFRADGRTLSEEEQRAARELLGTRTAAHQAMVRRLAGMFDATRGAFREGSVDLLWVPHDGGEPFLLVEGKTIDDDGPSQMRAAVGQVLFYEFFDVQPLDPTRAVRRCVALTARVADELVEYATSHEISLILVTEEGWLPLNALAEDLEFLLGPPMAGA